MNDIQKFLDSDVGKVFAEFVFGKGVINITYLVGDVTADERILIEDIILGKNFLYFDAPDCVVKHKDRTTIIEHFKIDASKPSRKGTLINKLTQGKTDTFDRQVMFNEVPDHVQTMEELDKSDFKERLKKYSSYENLADNFVKSYVKHYNEIGTYKRNILNSGESDISKNFEIVFFIQDITPIDKIIPDFSTLNSEENILEMERNNIGAYINQIKDKPVDHIFIFLNILNKPRIFYANKRMVTNLKMLPVIP